MSLAWESVPRARRRGTPKPPLCKGRWREAPEGETLTTAPSLLLRRGRCPHRPVCHGSAVASNLPPRGGLSKPPSVREVSNPKVLTEGETLHARTPCTPRRGRCPRSGAKRNKHPWGASPRRAPRRDPPKSPSLPCHSEPVTDVTGVGIRTPRHTPPPHSNSFNFFSTKSSQNPLPAFKFFQVFSR